MYENIRSTLEDYYFGELPALSEKIKNTVFEKMDEYDAKNPNLSSYRLKSKLYDVIAENIEPRIFPDLPFFFETGGFRFPCDRFPARSLTRL